MTGSSDRENRRRSGHLDAEDVQQDANGQLFDRIKISGDADVSVSRGSDANETRAVFGDHYKAPEMHISKGVLYIDSDESRSGGVVNISGSDAYPYVEVYVPDDWTIRDIEADSSCGDIDISDVTITRADIQSDSGDIHLGTTNFDKADITTDSGDISIIGAEGDSLTLKSGARRHDPVRLQLQQRLGSERQRRSGSRWAEKWRFRCEDWLRGVHDKRRAERNDFSQIQLWGCFYNNIPHQILLRPDHRLERR